ncbi:MAG: NUDIX domain-containing protein [Patescibacteria group bacterium]|nr:NUDIX domain-containing protein [Patescibacteria group bacterium]
MEQTQKDQIEKAGAIVLHHDDSARVALMYRAKEKDWSFPNGHIEVGETPRAACMREVEEETGLKADVLSQLPDNEYLHKTGKKIVTHMYLVRSKGGNFVTEHPEDKIEWVAIQEVKHRLAYDNLKDYYNSVLPLIESGKKISRFRYTGKTK